jgi:hypothetical protein
MKLITVSLITLLSQSAYAQIRDANTNAQSGTISTFSYQTSNDRCRLGAGFDVFADGTNPNTTQIGHSICRSVGSLGSDGFTALPGGNWMATGDMDPATAPCRLEGTVTATSLIALTCGVDP